MWGKEKAASYKMTTSLASPTLAMHEHLRSAISDMGIPTDKGLVWMTANVNTATTTMHVPDYLPRVMCERIVAVMKDLLPVTLHFVVKWHPTGLDPEAGRAAFSMGGYEAVQAMLDSQDGDQGQ